MSGTGYHLEREKSFEEIKQEYYEIAQQLCYDKSILDKIKEAESEIMIENIMISAREHLGKWRGEMKAKKNRRNNK